MWFDFNGNKSDMPHGCFSSGGAPTVWATSLLYFARQVWVPWDFNSFYFILFGSLVTLQIGEIATCMHSLSNREPIAPVFSSSKLHLLLQTLRISSPFKSKYIPHRGIIIIKKNVAEQNI